MITTNGVSLRGDCRSDTAVAIQAALAKAVDTAIADGTSTMTIDCTDMRVVNSITLAVCLLTWRHAQRRSCQLLFSNVPDRLHALAAMSQVDSLLFPREAG